MRQPKPGPLSLKRSMAADVSWGNTIDRAKRTAKARAARDAQFLKQAGGDPKRAESLRKAHMKKMALKSVAARQARAAAAKGSK